MLFRYHRHILILLNDTPPRFGSRNIFITYILFHVRTGTLADDAWT